jgi:hypothetical protein
MAPTELHCHFDEWETLLALLSRRFVQLDLAEIWMMFVPAEFDVAIRGYLAGLDGTDDEGWKELVDQAALNDPDVARYGLRGYQWDAPVPWED